MKIICWRIHIKTPTFWDMRTRDIWKVCLPTFTKNRISYKIAYFLRNLQTLRANNSRILKIKNVWTKTYSEIFKSALVYLSATPCIWKIIELFSKIWISEVTHQNFTYDIQFVICHIFRNTSYNNNWICHHECAYLFTISWFGCFINIVICNAHTYFSYSVSRVKKKL